MADNERREAIFGRLTKIFRHVFNDDSMVLTETTSAEDVPEWDSLMHVTLCVAVEREFRIRLNAIEIASLSNVGKLVDTLMEKE